MLACPACGQQNPDGFRFCGACAAPLAGEIPERTERKVITALFCDLVGSTAEGERLDPEDLQALLSRYHTQVRDELERFGGTVEKFIGDAVVALFGVPLAHEDDPERAVRAALAVRRWVGRQTDLHVRMAVNTGEALVVLGARAAQGEHVASGDVLNTAARLQVAAPIDGILVGEATFRATERAIEYREHEPVMAKGKAHPVHVWEVVQPRARMGMDMEPAPGPGLVGRARELRLLKDAFDRAREEREPQLVTLIGVPGIGKSRIVSELSRIVDADPELIAWRQGRCLPYGDGVTFWALGEIVKAQAGILESDVPDEVERKLRQAVTDPRLEAHLRPLVGLGAAELVAGDKRPEAFAAWRQFFETLAEERPLVLVVEDLHWADENLLDFLDHLVDWASGVALLVVCSARPEFLERRRAWGGGKPNALTISLSPLSDDETAVLIEELLAEPRIPIKTRSELLARAGGNPLYAEQYARILLERGGLRELPETVQGIVAARLDLLEPEQKALLQDAAVLGRTFWAAGLAAVSGLDRPSVEEQLHGLERRELVHRERHSALGADAQYAFLHVLIADVAYAQLPRAERAAKHVRAAEWIEALARPEDHAEMLAHHYLEAIELSEAVGLDAGPLLEPARFALRDAGDRAAALSAAEAAERFYDAALRLWPEDDPERPDLLYLRALPVGHHVGGGDPTRLAEARDALLAAGDSERAAELETSLADAFWLQGNRKLADEHGAQALALIGDAPPTRSRAFVLARGASRVYRTGDYTRALRLASEARAVAEQVGSEEGLSEALNLLGTIRLSVGDTAGLDDLERSAEIASASGNLGVHTRLLNNVAVGHQLLGDLERGFAVRSEGARLAEELGSESATRWYQATLVDHRYRRGDWDEALRDADDFLRLVEAGTPHGAAWQVFAIRAEIRLARDDRLGALADADQALRSARAIGDIQATSFALAGCAHVYSLAFEEERAVELSRELLEFLGGGGHMQFAVINLPAFACAAVRLGLGRDLVEALSSSGGSRWTEAVRAYVGGEFLRAAELLAQAGAKPEEAEARLRAGGGQIERALAFYRSVCATRYVREAESMSVA